MGSEGCPLTMTQTWVTPIGLRQLHVPSKLVISYHPGHIPLEFFSEKQQGVAVRGRALSLIQLQLRLSISVGCIPSTQPTITASTSYSLSSLCFSKNPHMPQTTPGVTCYLRFYLSPSCQGTSLQSYPMPPSLCIAPPVYRFTIIRPPYATAYTYSTITDSFRLGHPHYELITEHIAYLRYFVPEYYQTDRRSLHIYVRKCAQTMYKQYKQLRCRQWICTLVNNIASGVIHQ